MNICTSLYKYTCNVGSFSYGTAKGIAKQLSPAIYDFGLAYAGNTLGFSGLAANCISVGFGVNDVANGIFQLAKNAYEKNEGTPGVISEKCSFLKAARNIHKVVVGLAMVNTVFYPSPVANVILSSELLRRGVVNSINGIAHLRNSLNVQTSDSKVYDWAGIGESLVSIIWSVNKGVNGAITLTNNTIFEKKGNNDEVRFVSEITERSKSGHAAEITADWDHNGAFAVHRYFPSQTQKDLRDIYTVYSGLVKNDEEACSALREARELAGKPLDAAMIRAHGNQRAIIFGEGQVVSTTNIDTLARCLKETLSSEAPIFLNSCSTAQVRAGNRLNFAERLAGETGHPVFGSAIGSSSPECQIINAGDSSSPKPLYSCIFSSHWSRYGESVPEVSNPVTKQFGEYNRLIERNKDSRDDTTAQDDWLYTHFANKMTRLIPVDVWGEVAGTEMWQSLNKWWEKAR